MKHTWIDEGEERGFFPRRLVTVECGQNAPATILQIQIEQDGDSAYIDLELIEVEMFASYLKKYIDHHRIHANGF